MSRGLGQPLERQTTVSEDAAVALVAQTALPCCGEYTRSLHIQQHQSEKRAALPATRPVEEVALLGRAGRDSNPDLNLSREALYPFELPAHRWGHSTGTERRPASTRRRGVPARATRGDRSGRVWHGHSTGTVCRDALAHRAWTPFQIRVLSAGRIAARPGGSSREVPRWGRRQWVQDGRGETVSRDSEVLTPQGFEEWWRRLVGRWPQVSDVGLVGSQAFGGADPDSDWDVVVCLDGACYEKRPAKYGNGEHLEQVDGIEQRIAFDPDLRHEKIDVFFLRPDSTLTRWEWLHPRDLVVMLTKPMGSRRGDAVEAAESLGLTVDELLQRSDREILELLTEAVARGYNDGDQELWFLASLLVGDLCGDFNRLYRSLRKAKLVYERPPREPEPATLSLFVTGEA